MVLIVLRSSPISVVVVAIVRDVRDVDVSTGSVEIGGTVTVDRGGLYVNTKRVDGAGVVSVVGMRCAMSGTNMVVVSMEVGVVVVGTKVGIRCAMSGTNIVVVSMAVDGCVVVGGGASVVVT